MATAFEQGEEANLGVAAADVEGTYPFGAVELMGGEAEQVEVVGLDVEGEFADGLGGVGMEEDAVVVAEGADLADGVKGTDLVIGGHDRDEESLIGEGLCHLVGADGAVLVDGEDGEFDRAVAGQGFEGVEDGLVLGGGGDDVISAAFAGGDGTLERQVVGFGGA